MRVADIFEDSVEIDNRVWSGSPDFMYEMICSIFGRRVSAN